MPGKLIISGGAQFHFYLWAKLWNNGFVDSWNSGITGSFKPSYLMSESILKPHTNISFKGMYNLEIYSFNGTNGLTIMVFGGNEKWQFKGPARSFSKNSCLIIV
jgi:hypothetical protein